MTFDYARNFEFLPAHHCVNFIQMKGIIKEGQTGKNFFAGIEKNIGKRTAADYANHLAVTPNYLIEVVKK